MIQSSFIIALRNLWKDKDFSFLNIFGLAIGITCAGLILLWVADELSFNPSIPDKELVFAVPTNQKYDGEWRTLFVSTPGPLAAVLKAEIPEISKAARKRDANFLFTVADKVINSRGSYADKDLMEIFGLNFILGNPAQAFENKNSILLTKEVASNLFGENTPWLGREVQVDQKSSYIVTGVIDNFPANSTYSFSWLVPFENFTDGKEWTKGYGNRFTDTFVKLNPGAELAKVNQKVMAILPAKTGNKDTQAILFSAEDWHLRSDFRNGEIVGGRIIHVRLFIFVSLIILSIGCINFMNLATARSEKRAKEVGMRKTLGSTKSQLVFQFMGEALLTAFLSGILSVVFISMLLPFFNQMIGKQLSLDLTNPVHSLSIVLITSVCGLLSGLYPAFYLSSLKPIEVLKSSRKQSFVALFVRKGLVVMQFAVSILFIISSIVVYQQVQHVKQRDLGLNKNNLIEIPVSGSIIKNSKPIEQDLQASGLIQSIGLFNSRILSDGNNTSGVDWQGKSPTEDILVSFRTVSPNLFETVGFKIKEGFGFTSSEEADKDKVLVSESFAALLPTEEVLGKTIENNGETYTITGVVKNYLYGDMYDASDPVMFFHHTSGADYLYIRPVLGVATPKVIQEIEKVLSVHNPGFPFEYTFVDKVFDAHFRTELLLENLSKVFAGLAIIISCLGLFGLTAFTAEQRKKEIGVRKVLGSSVAGIVRLLSLDFMKLVLLAILIAVPVAWYLMESWLQGFAYRINIKLWVFVLAGLTAVCIAVLTISFHAIKAATANPIKSLRTE